MGKVVSIQVDELCRQMLVDDILRLEETNQQKDEEIERLIAQRTMLQAELNRLSTKK